MFSKIASTFLLVSSLIFSEGKKPEPKRKEYCADVLLYDTFGDGWGPETFFFANDESFQLTYSNVSTYCVSRTLRFCNNNGEFNFKVQDFSEKPDATWEVFWGVRYFDKYFYGTVGTEIAIDAKEVKFDGVFDTDKKKGAKKPQCQPGSHDEGANTYSIVLKDAREKTWFAKPYDTVDIEGFAVPSYLVYPKYYIARLEPVYRIPDRRALQGDTPIDFALTSTLYEGSLCKPGADVYSKHLENGYYGFRASGFAQGDESWELCNVTGVVGEQLLFYVQDGVCTPISKSTAEQNCNPTIQLVEPALNAGDIFDVEVLDAPDASSSITSKVQLFGAAAALLMVAIVFVITKVRKSDEVTFQRLPESSEHEFRLI